MSQVDSFNNSYFVPSEVEIVKYGYVFKNLGSIG
jgi:hypothetical protein